MISANPQVPATAIRIMDMVEVLSYLTITESPEFLISVVVHSGGNPFMFPCTKL